MNHSDRFDQAIDKLLADKSPRSELSGLDPGQLEMVRMAQLLRGSAVQDPRPDFVEQLHERIFPRPRRISRRAAFVSGLSALAAGLAAGVGLDRATRGTATPQAAPHWPVVPRNRGKWMPVAQVADVPPGAVHPFTAGAVQGFVLNRNGQYRALSRICTHMGCTLRFSQSEQSFQCPCHGAEFNLKGVVRYGPKGYPLRLPPLPEIDVRVNGEAIEVRAV